MITWSSQAFGVDGNVRLYIGALISTASRCGTGSAERSRQITSPPGCWASHSLRKVAATSPEVELSAAQMDESMCGVWFAGAAVVSVLVYTVGRGRVAVPARRAPAGARPEPPSSSRSPCCAGRRPACGPLVFAGLMVRAPTGPDQRWMLPYRAVPGPVVLLGADLLGRVLPRPSALQVAAVTIGVGVDPPAAARGAGGCALRPGRAGAVGVQAVGTGDFPIRPPSAARRAAAV
ncbi:hypothetical protein [Streptomyces sp. MI02-7b]|uniref:hypothetical protein n=1 Tax=Streptomyces sp. MI02-7b TaxID=462941 RepID=UPI0039F519C9